MQATDYTDAKQVLSELCSINSTELCYTECKDALNELATKLESEHDFTFDFDGCEFRIIHENSIDEIGIREISNMWEDCYDLSAIPQFLVAYIDFDRASADALRLDGYGHHFASYDGNEYSAGNWYIFRVN